ncbi:MAG: restriction endonuclease subunit S [Nitrospira sp.]|nr:restriction endonuclease subunit S [Nitrospira sp.]
MVKFGDIAQNVAVRVDPADAKTDVYVGLEHLDPSTLHLRQWGHPSDVTGQKLAFKKGDVIFGRRRAYQRKLAVAEFDGICSAHAMVVRAKPKMILPDFLPFFLQSDMFMERAIEISVGSLSPTINWKTLKVQEFPLPPLDEQKRIAEILWAADDAEEGFSKSIEQHRFLIRKVGVTFYKESGYPKYRFSEHVEDSAYGPRFSNALYDINGGIGQIRTTDISDSGDIEYSTVPLANLDVSAYQNHILNGGDLLISRSGTCGVASVYEDQSFPMIPGAFLIRFRLKTSLLPEFAREYFNSLPGRMQTARLAQGGVQSNIRGSSLLEEEIPIPDIGIQESVVSMFRQLRAELEDLHSHRSKLLTLKKSMLMNVGKEIAHV